MSNAFGYVRISKGRDKHAYSIDAQEAAIVRAYEYKAEEWGHPKLIMPAFRDIKVSGRNINFPNRPMAGRLIARMRPGDYIIVAKTDRAFRNTQDMLNTMELLTKAKVHMFFCDLSGLDTSSAIGKLFLTITSAMAQFEADRMSERTREAIEARKYLQLNPQALPPIGWKYVFRGEGRPRKPKIYEYSRTVADRCADLAMKGFDYKEIAKVASKHRWRRPDHYRVRKWNPWFVEKCVKASMMGFPITDKQAECSIEMPVFELEPGDEPVREGFFHADQYPAAE